MGLFRYGLSLTVVMFHCGGWSALSGRTAVFLFYVLSGYLMALVIDRTYGRSVLGVLRFWLNRALRIAPPYVFWLLVSLALLHLRGRVGFDVDSPAEPNTLFAIPERLLDFDWLEKGARSVWVELTFGMRTDLGALSLSAGGDVLPQSWSLGIEAWFYLCAPLLAFLWAKARWAFAGVAVASLALNVHLLVVEGLDGFDNHIYKNFLCSLFVFQGGMAIYGLRRSLGDRWARLAPALAGALFAAYVLVVAGEGMTRHNVEGFYAILPLGMAIVLLLSLAGRLPSPLAEIDRRAGDLAYGVFLCHFAAAFVLLVVQERIFVESGVFNFFGRYSKGAFGAWTCLLATAFSAGTLQLVERPIARLRSRVRAAPVALARDSEPAQPAAQQIA